MDRMTRPRRHGYSLPLRRQLVRIPKPRSRRSSQLTSRQTLVVTSIQTHTTTQIAISARTERLSDTPRLVLVVTRAWDTTADLVIRVLHHLSIPVTRINTEDFPTRASIEYTAADSGIGAVLDTGYGRALEANAVTAVYFRRPDPPKIDEAVTDTVWRKFAQNESASAIGGFLRLLDRASWINHPALVAEAEFKLVQLKRAQAIGFTIPRTTVTNNPTAARSFLEAMNADVIAKTLRSPLVSLTPSSFVYTHRLNEDDVAQLETLVISPCILQEWIPKHLEVRVVVVGAAVFAVAIHSEGMDDWRSCDVRQLKHSRHKLPQQISAKCVALVQAFGLKYGALDLILTPADEYVFLELNPNGEWGWLSETLGDDIQRAIATELAR
jgi:glutathione synthase/RimK-type ligase-like ATP-grasp enzyme